MSNVPPFPPSVMNQNDGIWRPPVSQRATIISTPDDEANEARRRYRAAMSQEATQQAAVPAMAHIAQARPARVVVLNDDGSVPEPPPPPLMGHMRTPEHDRPRALPPRPSEPAPMSPEQQRAEWARQSVAGAWHTRRLADEAESEQRERDYQRYSTETGRRR